MSSAPAAVVANVRRRLGLTLTDETPGGQDAVAAAAPVSPLQPPQQGSRQRHPVPSVATLADAMDAASMVAAKRRGGGVSASQSRSNGATPASSAPNANSSATTAVERKPLFSNNAIGHAMEMLKSERARLDGNLAEDFAAVMRGQCVYVPDFLCEERDRTIYAQLKEEVGIGSTASVIDWSRHELIENPDASPTFTAIVKAVAEYFDLDVYATRLNYYADGTKWKTFHHDSHAYGGRALREDFTVGVSLGSTRELQFLHEPSGHMFSFPQPNGACFAFTNDVNQRFMHGVPRSKVAVGDRLSIIAWGRRKTLNARNGGVSAGDAAAMEAGMGGAEIASLEDALKAAHVLVSRSAASAGGGASSMGPRTGSSNATMSDRAATGDSATTTEVEEGGSNGGGGGGPAAASLSAAAAKKKKNRLQ